MSYSKHQPSLYKGRGQDNQLLNTLINTHDLACGCKDPPSHLTHLLISKCDPKDFNKEEKQQIKQWCTTLEDGHGEEETGFDEGDLDALFTEDTTPEEG